MKLTEATEALERVGLGRYEALVFVNLSRAGAVTAGEVARVSGVNRVQTYRALDGLEARGLVEVTLDRPRRYAARALNDVFQMIADEKRSELERMGEVQGLGRGVASPLRSHPRAAVRPPPGDQRSGPDLSDPASVRRGRQGGGPGLHDHERPPALLSGRDQRGLVVRDAPRRQVPNRGRRERGERGPHV